MTHNTLPGRPLGTTVTPWAVPALSIERPTRPVEPQPRPPLFADEATAINAAITECDRAATDTVRWAIEAGRLLDAMKEKLPHGEYEAWVCAHCRVTPRMARTYRRCYRRSLVLKPETVSGFRRLRDLLRYCDAHDVAKPWTVGIRSMEEREALDAALRRHPGAVSDPVPYIIHALNNVPVTTLGSDGNGAR